MNQQTRTRSYGKIVRRFTSCSTRTSLLFESISAERRFISNDIAVFSFGSCEWFSKPWGFSRVQLRRSTALFRNGCPARARVNRFVVNATVCTDSTASNRVDKSRIKPASIIWKRAPPHILVRPRGAVESRRTNGRAETRMRAANRVKMISRKTSDMR